MKILSNKLTANDLQAALNISGLTDEGVVLNVIPVRTRSYLHGYDVQLRAPRGADRDGNKRKWPRGGWGPEPTPAGGTYNDWGYFIGALFGIDEEAKIGPYKSPADFRKKTSHNFPIISE